MNSRPLFTLKEMEQATGARLVWARQVPDAASYSSEVSDTVLGVSTDSRTIQPGELFIALKGARFDGHDFVKEALSRGAIGALVNGTWVPRDTLRTKIWVVADTLKALGDLAQFHRRRLSLPVVAITGSNGKTTTKAMLAHILSGHHSVLSTPGTQNNLIGVPKTLLRLRETDEVAVLELGTNRWGEIRRLTTIASPTIGVVTNIGPAHLETFGDVNGVLKAKGELWEAMDLKGCLVLNADDPLLWGAGKRLPHRVVWFSSKKRAHLWANQVQAEPWESSSLVNGQWRLDLGLPGEHHRMNALAAIACASVLGEEIPWAIERLASFSPVPGRLVLKEWEGCRVIDDSYNANPASLKAALEVFKNVSSSGRRIAVIGDMLELGASSEAFHQEAGRWMADLPVDLLLSVGPMARVLLLAAREAGFQEENGFPFDLPEEAGEFLTRCIRPGDTILIKGSRGMQMERVLTCCIISSSH